MSYNPQKYCSPEDTAKQQSSSQKYSNAERYSHINNAEVKKTEVRYGSVEQQPSTANVVGGAAGGAATSGSSTPNLYKTPDKSIFESSIRGTNAEVYRDIIKTPESKTPEISDISKSKKEKPGKVSEAAIFQQKTWGNDSGNREHGILRKGLGIAGREMEAQIGRGSKDGKDGEIDERAKGQSTKYGYKAGKFSLLGGIAISRGSFRFARFGQKLSKDFKSGVLTGSEVKKMLGSQAKENLIKTGSSLGSIIKGGTVNTVEDFHGSDDLGMQAITKPKDIVVGTRRTLSMVKATGKTAKKTVRTAKKTAVKVQEAGKAIYAFGKKIFSNPVVLKGIAILIIAVIIFNIVIAVVSSIASIIPVLSLKSEDAELSKTYLYITELDARMEDSIVNEDKKIHFPPIDEYHYYLNGAAVSKSDMRVYTNADLLLTYLDSKYEDYTFDGIIAGLFGTTVKEEIEAIHNTLHQVTKTRWTETVVGDDGSVSYIYHMDISLTTQSWEDYYESNKDMLLTEDQQEQYNAIVSVGVYSFRKSLSSPFVGVDWSTGVSSRWGWRIHPITEELGQHMGLDIAMPGGTPINACNAGTISTGYDADGWGNYIKVTMENGDYTLYAHLSSTAVSDGTTVNAGDIIGYVGTTGASTGNHLHLEYYKDGENLNPLIFVECDIVTTP